MRWQQLFADLQAQFEAEETAAEQAESASRARAEVGSLGIVDRLRGALGLPLVLACGAAGTVPARASAYFCWMNRSSSSTSTRHWPRPPIWMAISSLRRTRA